ncbi:MAG: hypothetical protein ACI8W8_000919 [Rhodothermales bacterium]|jgi:hypothetical protein
MTKLLYSFFAVVSLQAATIDFNRDVRPILSDRCYHCHGPDAKNSKSDFRLDTKANVFADLGGYFGVKPGSLKESELHARIHTDDADDVMPPLDSNRQLSQAEKKILDEWIEQGAPYAGHWAFEKPTRPALPNPQGNPIDAFVHARLKEEGLKPSPTASSETLLRRAALVTTGLLPSPEQLRSSQSYEEQVDEMLGSMAYAERQALLWLDAARFADTDGYQNDAERSNWPWRDWVIQAFLQNMPYDQFTVEQIAGDMLPEATPMQVLASAFNRNHRQNSEGGALAEEFLVENIIDRVETTSTVFLGLTMGCARCHDHKYDPLSQREFFQLYAYFNNIGEKGIGKGKSANPILKTGSPLSPSLSDALRDQQLSAEDALQMAKKSIGSRQKEWVASLAEGVQVVAWQAPAGLSAKANIGSLVEQDNGSWVSNGHKGKAATYTLSFPPSDRAITAIRLDALTSPAFTAPNKLARSVNGNFVLGEVKLAHAGKAVRFREARATFSQANYAVANLIDGKANTGWAISGVKGPATAMLVLDAPLKADTPLTLTLTHSSGFANHNIGRFRISISGDNEPHLEGESLNPAVIAAAKTAEATRSREQNGLLKKHYAGIDAPVRTAQKALDDVRAKIAKQGYGVVPVMVMRERDGEPVPAYFLNRGQYTEPDTSEALPRTLPAALLGDADAPRDRLELARWLVSTGNPLTARVVVNRLWQQVFGIGLVKTVEDFGSQGEIPSHSGLLDWLAVEFVESGWDYRALYRLILTSETFRQRSATNADLEAQDPENRLMARGPRHRLDGFAIRDTALQASGLLNTRAGGPPTKPYQPAGLWNVVASNGGTRYAVSKGADLYRKSLYTYWKRAVNPPRQIIFDAAGRETCNVNTRVTNTPLQALVLMNDVTFVEAARNLAQRVMGEGPASPESRLQRLYQLATARQAQADTLRILGENLAHFQQHFADNPGPAAEFLKAGQSPRDTGLDLALHAAYTAVAHLVLNLDETITLE